MREHFHIEQDNELIARYSRSIFRFAPTPFVFQQNCLSVPKIQLEINECRTPLTPTVVQEVSKDVIKRVSEQKQWRPQSSISEEELYMREKFIQHKTPILQLNQNSKFRRKNIQCSQAESCSQLSKSETCQSISISPNITDSKNQLSCALSSNEDRNNEDKNLISQRGKQFLNQKKLTKTNTFEQEPEKNTMEFDEKQFITKSQENIMQIQNKKKQIFEKYQNQEVSRRSSLKSQAFKSSLQKIQEESLQNKQFVSIQTQQRSQVKEQQKEKMIQQSSIKKQIQDISRQNDLINIACFVVIIAIFVAVYGLLYNACKFLFGFAL